MMMQLNRRPGLAAALSAALLLLPPAGAAARQEPVPAALSVVSNVSNVSDVDLDDVPIANALRLLAEIYDVSIATGKLPDTRVTVRLRGVGAREAFESVGVAAGLVVSQRGNVLRIAPRAAENLASRIVPGPFPAGTEDGLDGLDAAGVEVRRIGDGAILLAGPESGVKAASETLGGARRRGLVERVFPLGAAPGEETLKTVLPLLEAGLENATYEATGHQLTVSALPATLTRLEALLAELTRTPAQYEIEVRVVEVSRTALRQMGSQGSFGLDIRGGVLSTSFPFDTLTEARRFLPSPSDLAALGRLGGGGGSGESGSFQDSGFRFGRIDGRGIGLLIQMLEQSGEARVMASPKVTALDNREARISMVTTLRIPTFTQNQAFATTTVTGIEKIDVGTTLEVRPRRSEGGQILLSVAPEVSELEPEVRMFNQSGLTQGLPVVTRRRTETEVILFSGETLVIGGLITERETKTQGKTPGLGSIPMLGRLFRLEGKNTEGSELLVFVTPRRLPPPEERRDKVRVGEVWIPAALAAETLAARDRLGAPEPAMRAAAARTLEGRDGELLAVGVDVAPDVLALAGDRALEPRVAAALFLLNRRPALAVAELARFRDRRAVARAVLAHPPARDLAPDLAAAVAAFAETAGGSPPATPTPPTGGMR